ncbi:MAG: YdcF family protein [Clostridia bacterium]|nr:YdcF family protein [Clostridia bacterium]
MKKKKKKPAKIVRVVSWFLVIAGYCSLAYYALLLPYLGFSVSFSLFWLALGAGCLALNWLLKRVRKKSRRRQRRLATALAVVIAAALALYIGVTGRVAAGGLSRPAPEADYVLVLGARVKDNGPSVLLEYRIEKAAEYLKANKKSRAILCGGQGSNEPMSEAQAMYDSLVKRGIDKDRLILEDKSTSTEENIAFAQALMEGEDPSVVITTTGYHIYRALNTARALGLQNVSGNPAKCAWVTPLNYYTREFFAVLRDWIVK